MNNVTIITNINLYDLQTITQTIYFDAVIRSAQARQGSVQTVPLVGFLEAQPCIVVCLQEQADCSGA